MSIEEMRSVDVRTIDPATLVDITSIRLDGELPRKDRIRNFLEQIKNPYCYRVGKVVVKVSFADTDITLEDRLEHYIRGL